MNLFLWTLLLPHTNQYLCYFHIDYDSYCYVITRGETKNFIYNILVNSRVSFNYKSVSLFSQSLRNGWMNDWHKACVDKHKLQKFTTSCKTLLDVTLFSISCIYCYFKGINAYTFYIYRYTNVCTHTHENYRLIFSFGELYIQKALTVYTSLWRCDMLTTCLSLHPFHHISNHHNNCCSFYW